MRLKLPKIARGQYIDIPEGLAYDQLAYQRFLLDTALTRIKRTKGKKYKILIDRRIKSEFKKACQEQIQASIDDASRRINVTFGAQTGEYTRTDNLLHSRASLGSFPTGVRGLLMGRVSQLLPSQSVYSPFSSQNPWIARVVDKLSPYFLSQHQRNKKGYWMAGADFTISIFHIRQAVTIFILKNDSKLYPPDSITYVKPAIIDPQAEDRSWRSWRQLWEFQSGASDVWLRLIADDEALAMLYQEFPSCAQLQRELIFRSRDFHVPDHLKPVLHWSRIGQIKNVEWRRTLMTIGIVKNYPKPIAIDEDGELYPLDRNTRVLKITCPSTGRIYHLGVPVLHADTPKQARRWTMGLSSEFNLVQET